MEPEIRKILEMNAYDARTCTEHKSRLLSRRLDNLGASSVLFYQDPIEMVGAKGSWMIAENDQWYLDFYNNVPSVGHCHPKVVNAISEQVGRLNIHTRYLSRIVDDYIESLKETFPPNLDNILLCCTGSEANDLALRIAHRRTGKQGVIVTETAYHGNTFAVTEISPAALKRNPLPDHVVAIKAPSKQHYGENLATGFAEAVTNGIKVLQSKGYGFACFVCDSIFSSDGVHSDPEGFLQPAVDAVKEFGGLYIADEVQPGFGRTGTHMWCFQRHDVTPDIVTMGKPMGNGFPMAGVAAQSIDVNEFCEDVGYFNTFGGNPVAAAAGQAVLDIIREENLMENARVMGNNVLDGLNTLKDEYSVISDVRGVGLFIGVDICINGEPDMPSQDLATKIINRMKSQNVLIGAAGKFGNTIKLRPPLSLNSEEVDIFLKAMDNSLRLVTNENT